jgi:uncharacterized membrane protein YidH (DUF202 family)
LRPMVAPPNISEAELAGERTALAWNRSGLAIVVCVAVLLRHVWPLRGTDLDVALGLIAAAVAVWAVVLAVLTSSASRNAGTPSHGANLFRLTTAATLLLAVVGFVAAFAAP